MNAEDITDTTTTIKTNAEMTPPTTIINVSSSKSNITPSSSNNNNHSSRSSPSLSPILLIPPISPHHKQQQQHREHQHQIPDLISYQSDINRFDIGNLNNNNNISKISRCKEFNYISSNSEKEGNINIENNQNNNNNNNNNNNITKITQCKEYEFGNQNNNINNNNNNNNNNQNNQKSWVLKQPQPVRLDFIDEVNEEPLTSLEFNSTNTFSTTLKVLFTNIVNDQFYNGRSLHNPRCIENSFNSIEVPSIRVMGHQSKYYGVQIVVEQRAEEKIDDTQFWKYYCVIFQRAKAMEIYTEDVIGLYISFNINSQDVLFKKLFTINYSPTLESLKPLSDDNQLGSSSSGGDFSNNNSNHFDDQQLSRGNSNSSPIFKPSRIVNESIPLSLSSFSNNNNNNNNNSNSRHIISSLNFDGKIENQNTNNNNIDNNQITNYQKKSTFRVNENNQIISNEMILQSSPKLQPQQWIIHNQNNNQHNNNINNNNNNQNNNNSKLEEKSLFFIWYCPSAAIINNYITVLIGYQNNLEGHQIHVTFERVDGYDIEFKQQFNRVVLDPHVAFITGNGSAISFKFKADTKKKIADNQPTKKLKSGKGNNNNHQLNNNNSIDIKKNNELIIDDIQQQQQQQQQQSLLNNTMQIQNGMFGKMTTKRSNESYRDKSILIIFTIKNSDGVLLQTITKEIRMFSTSSQYSDIKLNKIYTLKDYNTELNTNHLDLPKLEWGGSIEMNNKKVYISTRLFVPIIVISERFIYGSFRRTNVNDHKLWFVIQDKNGKLIYRVPQSHPFVSYLEAYKDLLVMLIVPKDIVGDSTNSLFCVKGTGYGKLEYCRNMPGYDNSIDLDSNHSNIISIDQSFYLVNDNNATTPNLSYNQDSNQNNNNEAGYIDSPTRLNHLISTTEQLVRGEGIEDLLLNPPFKIQSYGGTSPQFKKSSPSGTDQHHHGGGEQVPGSMSQNPIHNLLN